MGPGVCRIRRCRGFSLTELLIVLAVIALLASLAWPGYQAALQRARRSDAREALLRGAQWLERVASIQGQYPEAAAYPLTLTLSASGHYGIRYAPSADLSTYTLTAMRLGAQAQDRCGDFLLDQAGQRSLLHSSAGISPADCWQR